MIRAGGSGTALAIAPVHGEAGATGEEVAL
jgi:hypothetical protein